MNTTKKIAVGCDHAGFQLKSFVVEKLKSIGLDVYDCGSYTPEPVDYPEYVLKVVWKLVSGECDLAIMTCGNGFAAAMLANRFPGMRAAVCHDVFSARTTKEMGDSNFFVLGQRVVGQELAWDLTKKWLESEFRGITVPRYSLRLDEIRDIEEQFVKSDWKKLLEEEVKRNPD